MSLRLFDAHCYLGRFKHLDERYFHAREDLLAEMDHFGIAEALVCDTLSRELDPRAGNPRIVDLCRDEPRLHPSWALAPPVQSLPFPLDELPSAMADADVRAVRLFPGHLEFTLDEWCVGPILEVMQDIRVPVLIDPTPALKAAGRDLTDWDAMVRLCKAFPDLPIIAAEQRWYWRDRTFYPALEACENLHLELSAFWMFRGIEFVCREYGAHRLLFGTRLPVRDAGATVAQLQYAEISDEEKQAIAGDNLRQMLDLDPQPIEQVAPDPGLGTWYSAVRAAQEPFAGETLVDIHAHIGPGSPYFLPDSEPDQLVRQMDRHGISKMVSFAFAGMNADWAWGNDFAHQAACDHPGRILPLAQVNLGDDAEMTREMERCCDEFGFWGVKLHPWWNEYPETGDHVRRCCEFVNDRKLMLLNHHWGPPTALDEIAKDCPNAQLIVGHLALDAEYARVINENDNVHICTCLPVLRGEVEQAVKLIDTSKIMFGSDVPDLPIPIGFGSILYARIDDEAKRAIMGVNAQRLLEKITCAKT